MYHSCQLCCDEFDFMITKASSLQFIGENTFSASELYLLYISLCTLIFYFNPIIGFRICMRAVFISCSEIFVKSIPQKVDTSLCNAKYCIPAVRMANCTLSVFEDSDALVKNSTKPSVWISLAFAISTAASNGVS